jgi:hypothetical protein
MTDLTEHQLLNAAKEALERPSYFGYYGDLPLFETWGLTFTQNRDSDAQDRSNYRRIFEDLKKYAAEHEGRMFNADPDDYVQDYRSSHWMHGWQEQIVVRVLKDLEGPLEVDNLTKTFIRATEIAIELRDCSIYDEDDLNTLESEEDDERFEQAWGDMLRRWDDDEGPEPTEDEKWAVSQKLHESEDPEGYDPDELSEVLKSLRPALESANQRIVDDPHQLDLFRN